MKNLLLFIRKFSISFFLMFFCFIYSFSQISTITYTGNTTLVNINSCATCCNVFSESGTNLKVGGFSHYPVSGGATFDGTSINMQSQYTLNNDNTTTNVGTAYAIAYSFTTGYNYVISMDVAYTATPKTSFPTITLSLFSSLPDPNSTNPIPCGAVSQYTASLGTYQNVIYPSQNAKTTYTSQNISVSAAMSYLVITVSGGLDDVTSISKITISKTPTPPNTCALSATGLTTSTGGTALFWNAVSGVSYYNLSTTDTHNGTPTTNTKTGLTTNSYPFCATAVGDNVSFKVQCVCTNGIAGAYSSPYSYTYSPTALTAPTGITYTSPSTLSWNAVPNATNYVVNASGEVYPVNGTTVSGSDAELTPGNAYNVTVQAQNACVSGPFSSPAIHFTAASCGPPTVEVVTAGTTVTLYPVSNAVTYNIGFENSNGTLAYTFNTIPAATATNYYQCTGIAPGYYYIVGQANCTIGTSTWGPSYNGNLQYARVPSGNVRGSITNNNSSIQTSKGTLVEVKKEGSLFNNLIGLSVYPNPSSSEINLRFNSSQSGNAEITITNELGETVLRKSVNENSGQNNYYFDLSKLINGIYTIKLGDKQGVKVQKIIIQK